MKLNLVQDKGVTNGYHGVIYNVEGMDNGLQSAMELLNSLRERIPTVSSVVVRPMSDHSSPQEPFCYNSYDECLANQQEFSAYNISRIGIFGWDDANEIIASINLDEKTIGFSSKPREKTPSEGSPRPSK